MSKTDYAALGPIDMDPVIRKQWAHALRWLRLSQGYGRLTTLRRHGKRKQCCLGVLCELAVKAGVIPPGRVYANGVNKSILYGAIEETSYLPAEVMKWSGLSSRNPEIPLDLETGARNLAVLNDNAVSFRDIADVIDGGEGR